MLYIRYCQEHIVYNYAMFCQNPACGRDPLIHQQEIRRDGNCTCDSKPLGSVLGILCPSIGVHCQERLK